MDQSGYGWIYPVDEWMWITHNVLWSTCRLRSTHETRRIVITDGLGIAVRLQHRIGLHHLILQTDLLLFDTLLGRCTDRGKVRNYLLGVFSFSGSRFASNQHRLILMIGQHVDVCTIGNGKNMRWHFATTLATYILAQRNVYTGYRLYGLMAIQKSPE